MASDWLAVVLPVKNKLSALVRKMAIACTNYEQDLWSDVVLLGHMIERYLKGKLLKEMIW